MAEKELILVLDNEPAFKERFQMVLDSLGLGSTYGLGYLPVSGREGFTACVGQVKAYSPRPILILLDIVLSEESSHEHYLDVRELIGQLRTQFPDIPICLITKHTTAEFSPVLFWASLSDVDGIVHKQYLRMEEEPYQRYFRLTKEDFQRGIDELRAKRRRAMCGTVRTIPPEENERAQKILEELIHPDERAWTQIRDLGACVLKNLIDRLREQEDIKLNGARLSYFRPGLSGSSLFKLALPATIGGTPEAWLLKVGVMDNIHREYDNHQKAIQDLPAGVVPHTTRSVGSYGLWGIYGVKLLRNATTLEAAITERPAPSFLAIIDGLCDCLDGIPSNKQTERMRLWGTNELYEFSETTWFRLRSVLEYAKRVFIEKCRPSTYEEVQQFVVTRSGILSDVLGQDEDVHFSVGHGDLNCRNILMGDSGRPLLIDFSHYGPRPRGRDLAKLRVDLLMSCLDHDTPQYFDWARLSYWSTLIGLNEKATATRPTEPLGPVETLLACLDQRIGTLVEGGGATWRQYHVGLLYYILLYLTYPDISYQKKVLGVNWAAALLIRLHGT